MESLNSKEKSKKTWQFIFIFFALAFLPVAAIFFSYFKLPSALSQDEKLKLMEYSEFDRNQKNLIKQLTLIDSNFNLLANENTNLDPTRLVTEITTTNIDIKKSDSSDLTQLLSRMVDDHTNHMNMLLKLRSDIGNYKEKNEILKEKASALPPAAANPAAPGPESF